MNVISIYILFFIITLVGLAYGFYKIALMPTPTASRDFKGVYYVVQGLFFLGLFVKYFSNTNYLSYSLLKVSLFMLFVFIPTISMGIALLLKRKNKVFNNNPHFQPKTLEELYEEAKIFRMNPFIRFFGIILGLLFISMPFLYFYDCLHAINGLKLNPSSLSYNIFSFSLFIILFPSIAGLFLIYSIPGKTPKFLLERMEKKIKNRQLLQVQKSKK